MNIYDATEAAYNNGYKQGVKDLAERVKEKGFYWDLTSRKYYPCIDLTHEYIDKIAKELLGERSEK